MIIFASQPLWKEILPTCAFLHTQPDAPFHFVEYEFNGIQSLFFIIYNINRVSLYRPSPTLSVTPTHTLTRAQIFRSHAAHMNLLRKPIAAVAFTTASSSLASKTSRICRRSSPSTLHGTIPSFLEILMTASACAEKIWEKNDTAHAKHPRL